jgi:hypothetical protein
MKERISLGPLLQIQPRIFEDEEEKFEPKKIN